VSVVLSLFLLLGFFGLAGRVVDAFAPGTTTTTRRGIQREPATVLRRATVVEAPVREPETTDRVRQVRERFRKASEDAALAKGCAKDGDEGKEWWRDPLPPSPRDLSPQDPLRVIVAGGGVAGLVAAAACHAKGMRVAIFEQASQYAPYGGPIQIQSNALRALQRINPTLFEEIVAAGTVTADRVSGLKIGYRKGGALCGADAGMLFPCVELAELTSPITSLSVQYSSDWGSSTKRETGSFSLTRFNLPWRLGWHQQVRVWCLILLPLSTTTVRR
jgi:hypothetical protein